MLQDSDRQAIRQIVADDCAFGALEHFAKSRGFGLQPGWRIGEAPVFQGDDGSEQHEFGWCSIEDSYDSRVATQEVEVLSLATDPISEICSKTGLDVGWVRSTLQRYRDLPSIEAVTGS